MEGDVFLYGRFFSYHQEERDLMFIQDAEKASFLQRLMEFVRQQISAQQVGLFIQNDDQFLAVHEPGRSLQPDLLPFLRKMITTCWGNRQPQVLLKEERDNYSGKFNRLQILLVPLHDQTKGPGMIYGWRYNQVFSPLEIEFLLKLTPLLNWLTEAKRKEDKVAEEGDFYGLVGGSAYWKNLVKLIKKISNSDAPVMIIGESGTGKELIARAIHLNSRRASKRFIPINCAAIPEFLLESELFGFNRGAFTGATQTKPGLLELADQGTFFLDEISDLSFSLQAKLLRLIQEQELRRLGENRIRKIDTRFISASHRDLEKEVKNRSFRQDLYYRLKVITIEVLPLRERKEDILILLNYFLNKYNPNLTKNPPVFSPRAVEMLIGYDWPGNIRELENEVRRCLALYPGQDLLTEDCLSQKIFARENKNSRLLSPFNYFEAKAEFERRFLHQALARFNFNKTRTAAEIGLSRQGLFKLLKKHKISFPPHLPFV